MKNKILSIILSIILIVIFTNNIINADVITAPFSNTYRNPNIQTYMLDASLYSFNNVSVSEYATDKHIRFLAMNPVISSGDYTYYHSYFGYNEIDSQIKIYDGYIYFYVKGLGRNTVTLRQDIQSYFVTKGSTTTGAYSSTSKAVFKISIDKSDLKFKIGFTDSNINSVDDYIISDTIGNFQYYTSDLKYTHFVELNSIGSLTGETFTNNADIQNPTYQGTLLSDKQSFINWIISEQKYTVFADYGIDNAVEVVDDIVNLYEQYQKNPLSLFLNVPKFLISNGSIFSSVDKAKELINYVSALYQEFKLERRPTIFTPEQQQYLYPQPYINPTVTDKYIDIETDTTEVSLLREILRTLIIMPQNIFNFFDYYMFTISSNVSLLSDYVAQLPSYLTDLLYNRFISPINIIVDAINNIETGGSSSTYVDVVLPSEKEIEFNNFLDSWNNNFSSIIQSKFPISNQLSNLFDDFFIKAGIDIDKDGVLYSYYNPNIVGSSGDSDLSTFYSTFDNANVSYLDDVAYSSDIPSLTIRIKGVDREIINFRFYAKYRQQIFTIMSFILWFAFLFSVYKSLPNIIGNVSDITNTVDEFESKIYKGDNF